jgi:DNA primase
MIPIESVRKIPIADVCNALNIPLIRVNDNTLQTSKCPTGHESRNGNCFSVNTGANYFQCFSCGQAGDTVKLVQITKGFTFTDSLKWMAEVFNISDDPDYTPR